MLKKLKARFKKEKDKDKGNSNAGSKNGTANFSASQSTVNASSLPSGLQKSTESPTQAQSAPLPQSSPAVVPRKTTTSSEQAQSIPLQQGGPSAVSVEINSSMPSSGLKPNVGAVSHETGPSVAANNVALEAAAPAVPAGPLPESRRPYSGFSREHAKEVVVGRERIDIRPPPAPRATPVPEAPPIRDLHSTVEDEPTSTGSVPLPSNSADPSSNEGGAAPPDTEEDADNPLRNYRYKVDDKMWPEFAPGEGGLEGTGSIFLDFVGSLASRWAKGVPIDERQFGNSLFASNNKPALAGDLLPHRLYDLVEKRVVLGTSVPGPIKYAAISHVWGDVKEIDGRKYGVDWKIPIRTPEKLDQILEAARMITGVEYVWIDVLCLDQRKKNETEIAKMKMYYANAVGCLVWLDNAFNDDTWGKTLSAIEEINKLYKLDKHGTPTVEVGSMFGNQELFSMSMSDREAFSWIVKLKEVEKAPWFKRVWTLQEGVIPDSLLFCTPERYMVSGANIYQIIGLCGVVAKILIDSHNMTGAAINQELMNSECWKMLRLRQLYRKKQLSYWHVARAVRSRNSKYEQDRVLGTCGMINGTTPIINYDRSLEGLHQELWKASVDDGNFSACCFLGGSPFHPDLKESRGLITPGGAAEAETHILLANENSIRMDGVGIDRVDVVHPVVYDGTLKEWGSKYPQFLQTSPEVHIDLARAFEVPTTLVGGLCPGSFAAFSMGQLDQNLLDAFGSEFSEAFIEALPQTMLTWIKCTMLMPPTEPRNYALVVIWTASSPPQLAMIESPMEGQVIVVTPSSYVETPGHGCLLCQIQSDGTIRKIGVGIGSQVKAATKGSFLMTG